MTALGQNRRPNCDRILETKIEWGLSPSDLSNESIVKSFTEKSFETELLENFIKLKFKI
jgi:hypothetical protein